MTSRETTISISEAAAEYIRSRFGSPGLVSSKGSLSPTGKILDLVTEVDEHSEKLVADLISVASPDSYILAEETGLTDAKRNPVDIDPNLADKLWLVDPLDGTVNFAHSIPHFAVSIAYYEKGTPTAGAIVDPMLGEVFSFERTSSMGEEWRGESFLGDNQLKLSSDIEAQNSVIYIGGGDRDILTILHKFRGWRQMGSAALALAWGAAGRTCAYLHLGNLNPWDFAVGAPLVVAAGGVVTTPKGDRWNYPVMGTSGIASANSAVHSDILLS